MSLQKQSLLAEVLANPDDDIPRLIYADYLEDSGDPRGAFIRAQCQLAQTNFLEPTYYQWLEQSSVLQHEYGELWEQELGEDVKIRKGKFYRGFITEATILASALVKDHGALFFKTPIHWLRLNRVKGKGKEIAQLEALTRLRGLDISGIKIPAEDLAAIFSSDQLTNLTGLKTIAYDSQFGREEVSILAQSKAAETLNHLELVAETGNLTELCKGHGFPELEHLKIQRMEERDLQDWFSTLADLKAPKLSSLSIEMHLSPDDVEALQPKQWGQLKKLSLKNSFLDGGTLNKLRDAGAFQSVESLDLQSYLVPLDEVAQLFTDDHLNNCRELKIDMADSLRGELHDLFAFEVGARYSPGLIALNQVAKAMAKHKALNNLHILQMFRLPIGGLSTLLESGILDQLESLKIWHSALSEDDIASLTQGRLAKSLKSFELCSTRLTLGGIRRLERAEFPNLVNLQISATPYSLGTFSPMELPDFTNAPFGDESSSFYRPSFLSLEAILRLLSCDTFQSIKSLNLDGINLSLSDFEASANLPDIRVISQQNIRGTQREVKALLESERFDKLFKLKMTGSFPAKISDKLNRKFGPEFEM